METHNLVQEIIQKTDHLEPVPQVIHQLMEIVSDPDIPASEVTNIIVYDPAITANLLIMANSAYFGLRRKINSVHDAIVMLGLSQVVEIALMHSMSKKMNSEYAGYGLALGELWKQSVSCALLAQSLAEQIKIPNKHDVFTAALLKDIGIIILDVYAADHTERLEEMVLGQNSSLIEAERKIMGIDHAELGGRVALKWGFGKRLSRVLQNHHFTVNKKDVAIETAIVYLADCLCTISGINSGLFSEPYPYYDAICNRLNISESVINSILADFYSRKDDIYGLLSVI